MTSRSDCDVPRELGEYCAVHYEGMCGSCKAALDDASERDEQRSHAAFYGAGTPQTDRERHEAAYLERLEEEHAPRELRER